MVFELENIQKNKIIKELCFEKLASYNESNNLNDLIHFWDDILFYIEVSPKNQQRLVIFLFIENRKSKKIAYYVDISCLHYVLTYTTKDELSNQTNELIGKIENKYVSSEYSNPQTQRKYLELEPEEQFRALKSWAYGICENADLIFEFTSDAELYSRDLINPVISPLLYIFSHHYPDQFLRKMSEVFRMNLKICNTIDFQKKFLILKLEPFMTQLFKIGDLYINLVEKIGETQSEYEVKKTRKFGDILTECSAILSDFDYLPLELFERISYCDNNFPHIFDLIFQYDKNKIITQFLLNPINNFSHISIQRDIRLILIYIANMDEFKDHCDEIYEKNPKLFELFYEYSDNIFQFLVEKHLSFFKREPNSLFETFLNETRNIEKNPAKYLEVFHIFGLNLNMIDIFLSNPLTPKYFESEYRAYFEKYVSLLETILSKDKNNKISKWFINNMRVNLINHNDSGVYLQISDLIFSIINNENTIIFTDLWERLFQLNDLLIQSEIASQLHATFFESYKILMKHTDTRIRWKCASNLNTPKQFPKLFNEYFDPLLEVKKSVTLRAYRNPSSDPKIAKEKLENYYNFYHISEKKRFKKEKEIRRESKSQLSILRTLDKYFGLSQNKI